MRIDIKLCSWARLSGCRTVLKSKTIKTWTAVLAPILHGWRLCQQSYTLFENYILFLTGMLFIYMVCEYVVAFRALKSYIILSWKYFRIRRKSILCGWNSRSEFARTKSACASFAQNPGAVFSICVTRWTCHDLRPCKRKTVVECRQIVRASCALLKSARVHNKCF